MCEYWSQQILRGRGGGGGNNKLPKNINLLCQGGYFSEEDVFRSLAQRYFVNILPYKQFGYFPFSLEVSVRKALRFAYNLDEYRWGCLFTLTPTEWIPVL